jgi:adenylate cyclase
MRRNVEIKARVGDLSALRQRVEPLADDGPRVLQQEDTFFHCPNGRLKLRRLSSREGELIYYRRHDSKGPRESDYIISPTHEPRTLTKALSGAFGIRGVVRKRRTLFLVGQTRVHLDEVEGLGTYLELEVVLKPDQTAQEGMRVAGELMVNLGIEESDLVGGAYIDLLEPKAQSDPCLPDE